MLILLHTGPSERFVLLLFVYIVLTYSLRFENQTHSILLIFYLEKVNTLYFCHIMCHQKLHMWLKRQMLPIFHQYYLGSFFPYSLEEWGLVMQLWPGPRLGIPNHWYWWICRGSKNWKCVWICYLVKLVFSWNWIFFQFLFTAYK